MESSRPDPARPGPTRPDPTRPAISATRVRALKKPDFGTPVLVSFGAFFGPAWPGPAQPGPARPAWPGPARPDLARFGGFRQIWVGFGGAGPDPAWPSPARSSPMCLVLVGLGGFLCVLVGFECFVACFCLLSC